MPFQKSTTRKPVGRPPSKVGAVGRKPAPKNLSVVDEYYQDESLTILDKATAALGPEAEGMDFMYGSTSPTTAERLSIEGWVQVETSDPEKPEGAKKKWRHRVDPLMMRPKGRSQRMHNMAAEVARSQLRNTLEAKGETGITPETED